MLAAGKSSRMEKWKMTLPCKDSTVIECSVRNALEVCSRVILVVGYRAGELEAIFHEWDSVEVVLNPLYEKGMFSSVKKGTTLVNTEKFFISLGDMPLVGPAIYRTLLLCPQVEAVIPKYRGKKGHPLLLSGEVARCIAEFDDTKTLREVLAEFPGLTVPVEDNHILLDIDIKEDYKKHIGISL